MIEIQHFLILSSLLFLIGVFGIFLNRKNVIIILMSIELILLAVNINFVSGRYTKKLPTGFGNFYIALEEQSLPVQRVTNKGKFIYWEFGDLLPIC